MQLGTKFLIKRNALLHGGEPTLSLAEALQMKRALDAEQVSDPGVANLAKALSAAEQVHSVYGESGLFRLVLLAMPHRTGFDHFFEVIIGILALLQLSTPEREHELKCDNDKMPQGEDLRRFNSHVMMPSLARKLYNPGRHCGYLVYGLGGPRILVSHRFRGVNGELYDVYNNSVDVATSLITRGYHGSFLFLDNMPGLNREIRGVPGWLLWFSMIAAQSDLVVFIKSEKDFSISQQREIEYTSDRVQKKIVGIPSRELRWAQQPEDSDATEWIYFDTDGKRMTRDEYLDFERQHSKPLLDQYVRPIAPHDRLIRIDAESGDVTAYPLDYPLYH